MIIDILRNYPVDGKLYSTAYGDLKFKSVYNSAIHTYSDVYNKEVVFDKNGRLYIDNGIISDVCMLYPSRGNHMWSNWRDVMFSAGDFLFDEADTNEVYIFSNYDDYNKVIVRNKYGDMLALPTNHFRFASRIEKDNFCSTFVVNKQLDDLYGSVVTDMRKEIPGSSKGRYLSFEKLGIDKNLSDDKISMLQDIVKNVPDEDKWPVLFKGAGISDLIETIDFVNTFDCRVISDTTIPEDSITDTLEIFKKLNTKDYKNISNYYNIALGNKKIYNKLLYINKLVYNKPLDLIKSGKNKNKVLVKNNREELDYERGKKST